MEVMQFTTLNRSSYPLVTVSRSTCCRRSSIKKWQNCVQKTVEVIQLVPQERIQERIAEQVVDIPLPQIIEEMLFSSTYASESYGRTDRGRLRSPVSGGNFRVGVIRHAFHQAQILRAHATRSQVSSSFSLLSWGRAFRRTLKPVTPLEPLMESSRSAVLLTTIPRPMHRISSELVSPGNAAAYSFVLRPPVPKCKGRLHSAHTREHAPNDVVVKVPVRSCRECHQKTAEHQFVDRQ